MLPYLSAFSFGLGLGLLVGAALTMIVWIINDLNEQRKFRKATAVPS